MTLQKQLNELGAKKEPFLFLISYNLEQYDLIPLKNLPKDIRYSIDRKDNYIQHPHKIKKTPISLKKYKNKFNKVQKEILDGNTYLINLTAQTTIQNNLNLEEVYKIANAKFKLYYKDEFICFSPERFCEIKNNTIFTYPMKGTIDANIPDAKEIILNDPKELAEHTMVVDLLRNDLSIVSKNVTVDNFRYCDKIRAGDKELLQISSKISGKLENNWQNNIGDIITSLLPAGSITGTPKKKTMEIIEKIEKYERGYFTGVFGIFDGDSLDSAVMIRFIEKDKDGNLSYKSGGGITCDSDINKEYKEMIDKVYIP